MITPELIRDSYEKLNFLLRQSKQKEMKLITNNFRNHYGFDALSVIAVSHGAHPDGTLHWSLINFPGSYAAGFCDGWDAHKQAKNNETTYLQGYWDGWFARVELKDLIFEPEPVERHLNALVVRGGNT